MSGRLAPPLPLPPLGLFPPLGGFSLRSSEAPSASSKLPSVFRTLGIRPPGGGGSGEILPSSSGVGEGERETSAESGLFLLRDDSEDLEEEEAVLEEELEDLEVEELEELDL